MLNPYQVPSAVVEKTATWQAPVPVAGTNAHSRVESSTLLRGSRELLIAHAGQEYRLRLTRNDKLILTK